MSVRTRERRPHDQGAAPNITTALYDDRRKRTAVVRRDQGGPRCPAGCEVLYARPNRKTRRRLERAGRPPVDELVAVHADDCPFNRDARTAQHTAGATNLGRRSVWR